MAEPKQKLTADDIVCLGHLKKVFPLLDKLKEVGCDRDTAGNRRLFFSDYCKLMLLYAWNPLLRSIRDLQNAVSLPRVARAMGVERFSLGSFSESCRVFKPQLLKDVIQELAGEARTLPADPRLSDLNLALTLVDGTVQQLAAHTVGGVVAEAQPILTEVPDDNALEVEACGGRAADLFPLASQNLADNHL